MRYTIQKKLSHMLPTSAWSHVSPIGVEPIRDACLSEFTAIKTGMSEFPMNS